MAETPSLTPALRIAALVAQAAANPAALAEHRAGIKALAKALRSTPITLSVGDGATLLVNGEAVEDSTGDAAVLAARLATYGVETLMLGSRSAEADLLDLVRLLATEPTQEDPAAFFAVRATAIDARGIPRVLRSREPSPEPIVESPSAAPIVESSSAPRRTPRGTDRVSDPHTQVELAPDLRSERLSEALAIPESKHPAIAAALTALEATEAVDELAVPLQQLTAAADLAFRTGRFDDLLDALAGLVAIEYKQLEGDASDERRREFGQAVRRLASPLILRTLAGMRHRRADDALAETRLQAVLYRFGTDGADALIDEWATVSSASAQAQCLEALRNLRRTHDALFDLVRDTDDSSVRRAARLLGALGDARSEVMLLELLRHPEATVRRDAVAALERFRSATSLDALGVSLLDDAPLVRLRAVHALSLRGAAALPNLVPLLDREPDADVLSATVMALARIGTPESVQALVRVAYGESGHARKRAADYRLNACRALVQIRTPQAMAAVQGLRDDRDKEVRAGAFRLVAQAARRTTTGMRALSAP